MSPCGNCQTSSDTWRNQVRCTRSSSVSSGWNDRARTFLCLTPAMAPLALPASSGS